MKKVKKRNPDASCYILYDKLYVDNKMYVWDLELGQVRRKHTNICDDCGQMTHQNML